MRTRTLTLVGLCTFSLAACQPADRGTRTLSAEDEAAVVAAVEQTIESYFDAIQELDVDRGLQMWADVEGFVLAADGELIDGYDAFVSDLRTTVSEVDRILEMEIWSPHTRVLDPDAASTVIEYRWAMIAATGDTVRSHGSWMYVVERFNDGWKIVHSAGTHLYDDYDVAAVRNMEHDFFAAQMAGDQDAWAALVDIDPVWMPPGAPTVAGSEAVREFARPMFEEWVVGDVSADADYGTFGDWGYSAWREGTWTITPKAGGEPISETATALLITHRGEDGQWRFARSMWNQVTPGEPPTPVAGQEPVELVAIGPEEDIAAIKRHFQRYEEVVAAKDMSGIAGLWTEDALWMPPGSPSLGGTQAFMRLAGDFLETHDVVGLEMDLEEVQAADGMAFVRVAASGTYVPLAGGEEPWAFTEREWFIMQRQNDGSWLATHCIWHPDVAAG